MRIPIRRGRFFTTGDTATGPEVAVINERAAQRFFAGVDPIGQRIRVSAELARHARNGPKTIVGVVGNVKYGGLDEETPAEIYLPYQQQPVDAFTVAVRSRGDAVTLIRGLRREVAAVDPALPLADISSLEDLVDASIAGRRFTLLVFLVFGAIAVALWPLVSMECSRIWSAREHGKSVSGWRSGPRAPMSWGCSFAKRRPDPGWHERGTSRRARRRAMDRDAALRRHAGRPGDVRCRGVHARRDRCVCNVPAPRRAASVDPAEALRAD